jgi:hypothetical protein
MTSHEKFGLGQEDTTLHFWDLIEGELRLALGGTVLSFVPASSGVRLDAGAHHQAFISRALPEVKLRVHQGPAPYSELSNPIFDSGGNWTLYRLGDKPVIRIRTPKFDPYQMVILQPDFECGDIYCEGEAWTSTDGHLSPLGYPLEEVLVVNLLARGRGVLLHACGVRDGDQGLLFAGTSGAGKSTLTRLWEEHDGVTVLSDDRVIVREHDGRFWAYGTPWHGDAWAASPDIVPLERIFIIQHASENQAVALEPSTAVSRLLTRSFPTFWDAEGMAFTLDFLGRLVEAVPCYELGFVPEQSVVDFLRSVTLT